jgi:hypothetical protein
VTNALGEVAYPVSIDTIGDLPCLVRPFIEGVSLRERISENGMDVKAFLETAIEIVNHLQLIHQYNVIHKDINPDNIICLLNAGAYGYTMASNYNGRPRPAEVMYDQGSSSLIRRAETIDDLLRTDLSAHF